MDQSSFNSSSPYACPCRDNCLPDGFVDIAKCFYNFPVSLTKPHYMDAEPREMDKYEGLYPDKEKHDTFMDFEPILGIPVKLQSAVQANIAVRTSSANPITGPLNGRQLPLMWIALYCDDIPQHMKLILQLRVVIAPRLLTALEAVLMLAGIWLIVRGLFEYRAKSPAMVINLVSPDEYCKASHPLFDKIQLS